MIIWLLLLSVGCIAISGVPGLLLGRRAAMGQLIATLMNVIGSAIGGIAVAARLWNGEGPQQLSRAWSFPIGQFAVGVDDLSALFLVPMLLISALGSIYDLEYWKQARHPGNGRKLRLCWGLLTSSMMLVVLARDAVVFLIAWEIMALAAFFLVATEDKKPEVRRAAWIYLVAAHVGTLLLFAFFGLLRVANGSFNLWTVASGDVPTWLATSIFVTGVVGFGLKAGIMPLHVWLPGAHANAPSHVSAILSGVLLKTGVYGIMRVAAFLPHPPIWWGTTLLVVGSISGILGIAFAVAQHDFKRLLAYSSIENVGIIMIGVGLALLGRSSGHPEWIVLGLGGSLFHVLNHSLFKPLLFMGAGNILHASHTRRIDLLGGLAKTMPRTFRLMTVGAMAICGLPPFNGFVSEFLIYIGLFRTADPAVGKFWIWAALSAPALALIGALAVSTFVKLLGAVFLGTSRTHSAERAHDPGALMLAPMLVLGLCCAVIGVMPTVIAGFVQRAADVWDPAPSRIGMTIRTLVGLNWISAIAVVLIAAAIGGKIALGAWRHRRPSASAGTWDCGYARPTPRIQYSGSSFGQMLTDLFGWVLWPRKAVVALRGLFPDSAQFSSEVPDTVLDRGVLPAFSLTERLMSWARPIQRGSVQIYLLYVLIALLGLLLLAMW
jgi:hydrogenase-4 component B